MVKFAPGRGAKKKSGKPSKVNPLFLVASCYGYHKCKRAFCLVCGFDIYKGVDAVPSAGCYSRFIKKLTNHEDLLLDIFQSMQETLKEQLPDFGTFLAVDGKSGEKNKTWFGYTLHLIADTKYELPVAFTVLPASVGEQPVARELIDRIERMTPEILPRCQYFCADKVYDEKKIISKLWDDHGIYPVIDNRML